jgi:hypothetical protein
MFFFEKKNQKTFVRLAEAMTESACLVRGMFL